MSTTATKPATSERPGFRRDWNPSKKIDVDAFTLCCLRASQAMSPWAPESVTEWAFIAKWHGHSQDERELALEKALNHFVGGTLQAAIDGARRRRMVIKQNAKW